MIRDTKEAIEEVKWLLSSLEYDLYDSSSYYSEQHQDSLKDWLNGITCRNILWIYYEKL